MRVLCFVLTGTADLYGEVGVCVTLGRNAENSVVEIFVGNSTYIKLTDTDSSY